MKKLLALLLAAAFTFSVAAIAQDTASGEKKAPAATTEKKEAKAEKKAAKKEAKTEKKATKKAAKKEAKEKKAEEKK